MKESGIGTPATRAAIIETLFTRNYIKREKNRRQTECNRAGSNCRGAKEEGEAKSLIPTEKGLSVYETVKDKKIADVAMTGGWENALAQIECGDMQPETFRKAIESYTRQITAELLETKIVVSDDNTCLCPKCKTAKVRIYPKVAKCTDEHCGLVVFRSVSEKQLSDSQVTDLLTKGKTVIIKSFKSKAGKAFDAALKFDENYRVTFDFSDKPKNNRKK